MPYGYRSFDRQYLLVDNRLGDYLRPSLWQSHSSKQLFFASLLTKALGAGPALTITADVPDLDYFSGRGAKDVVPLYRDAAANHPNLHPRLLTILTTAVTDVTPPPEYRRRILRPISTQYWRNRRLPHASTRNWRAASCACR
jgi:hypothetical protein